MNYNQLISKLKRFEGRVGPAAIVFESVTGNAPSEIISWRGSYEQPSILFENSSITLGAFIRMLEDAIDEPLHGWHGGEYDLDVYATVWADGSGSAMGRYIRDAFLDPVNDHDWHVVLVVGREDIYG